MGFQEDGSPTEVAWVQGSPNDLRVPDALGTYFGREMLDGSEWDGLDTYFLLHGMSGADARAHTRNCTISELCAHRASAAPLLLPHSGGQPIVTWKPSHTAAQNAKSACHLICFICRLFPVDQAQRMAAVSKVLMHALLGAPGTDPPPAGQAMPHVCPSPSPTGRCLPHVPTHTMVTSSVPDVSLIAMLQAAPRSDDRVAKVGPGCGHPHHHTRPKAVHEPASGGRAW